MYFERFFFPILCCYFHLLIETHKKMLQKNINWYCNNYVEYKIISDYEFLKNQ
jgi:hypothetical protein